MKTNSNTPEEWRVDSKCSKEGSDICDEWSTSNEVKEREELPPFHLYPIPEFEYLLGWEKADKENEQYNVPQLKNNSTPFINSFV